jgi:sulfur carrier protein
MAAHRFTNARSRSSSHPVGPEDEAIDNVRMDIRLNGIEHTAPAACTIAGLLEQAGLAGRRVAVEVNGEIVPRGLHATHALQEGDRIEIVHALGGG